MTIEKKPSELTYQDYQEQVEFLAEVVQDNWEEEDWHSIHDVISDVVSTSEFVTHRGYRQATVMLSDTDPDTPDYTEAWENQSHGVSTYSDAVQEAARICLLNDVTEQLEQEGMI